MRSKASNRIGAALTIAREARHRCAVRPADPDADHPSAVEADRPGVAIAVGGAGLVGDAAGRAVERRRHALENVGDVPGGGRREHRRPASADRAEFDRSRLADAVVERHRRAAAGDRRIEGNQIAERHADAAEPDGQARRRLVRQLGIDRGALQPRHQPRRADGVERHDGRNIERLLKRLAHGHRAAMEAVEVRRRVAVEAGRPVLDQRLGNGKPLLESEAVDERLQRRARRADGARHVDMAVALIVEEPGRADRGEDVAAGFDRRPGWRWRAWARDR